MSLLIFICKMSFFSLYNQNNLLCFLHTQLSSFSSNFRWNFKYISYLKCDDFTDRKNSLVMIIFEKPPSNKKRFCTNLSAAIVLSLIEFQ